MADIILRLTVCGCRGSLAAIVNQQAYQDARQFPPASVTTRATHHRATIALRQRAANQGGQLPVAP
jgi:hypothetical protein